MMLHDSHPLGRDKAAQALILTAITVVMVLVLVWREVHYHFDTPGPKTWAFGVVLLLVVSATIREWREAAKAPNPDTPPRDT